MIIELNGTGEEGLNARARRMVKEGVSRDELAVWARDAVPIFTITKTVGWWADHELIHKRGTYRKWRDPNVQL